MMKFIPKVGFFVLITLLSSTSTIFPFKTTVNSSISSTEFLDLEALAQTQDSRKTQADQLQQQGINQLNQDKAEKALKSLEKALSIYQEIKATPEIGQTLKHLGNVYYTLENHPKAIEYQQQALNIAKAIDDQDLQWRTLNNIGQNYYWQSNYTKALDYYQQSLAISQAIDEWEGETLTLDNLGDVYYELGNYEQAINYYQQSLKIALKINNKPRIAMAIFHLGKSYDALEEYDKAINYFKEALSITKEVNDPSFEKAILIRLGFTYGEVGLDYEIKENYDKALEFYQLSLIKAQENNDTHVEALAKEGIERIKNKIDKKAQGDQLLQQGIKQFKEREIKEAEQSLKQASSLYQEIGNFQGELQVLNRLSLVHQNLKEFDEAIEVLESQLALSSELGNLPLFASALAQLQGIYLQQKDYPKSIEYGELLLQTAQDLKNNQFEGGTHEELAKLGVEMEALALDSIVMAYQLNGDLSKALEYSQKNLSIAKELEDDLRIAAITYQMAGIYGELNNYFETINYLEKSYNLADKINNSRIKIRSRESLGIVYFSLGDFHKAQEYTEEAKTLVQEINHGWMGKKNLSEAEKIHFIKSELEILNLLANIHLFGLGEINIAKNYYQEMQQFAQETRLTRYEADAKLGLGVTYGVEGKYEKAVNYLEEALKIEQENTSQFDRIEDNKEALNLNLIAYAYGSSGNYKKALEYAQKSLSIIEKFENSKIEKASSLSAIGRTYFLMGNFKESEKYVREAIKTFENLREGIGDKTADFFSDIYGDEYELLQQVLIAQNKHIEALEVAEQGRARAFVELLAKRLNPNSKEQTSIPVPNIKQIKKIAEEQNATLVEYSIIHDPSQFLTPVKIKGKGKGQNRESELFIWVVKPTGEVAFRRVNIAEVLPNQEELSTDQLTSSYQLAAIYIAPWITATTIVILVGFIGLGIWQIELLETSAKTLQNYMKHHPAKFWLSVFLVTALTGGLIYLNLSNKQTTNTTSNDTKLGELVFLVNPPTSDSELRQLHQLLIEPIADLLPTNPQDRIIFIPQGTLFYVPFPALQNASEQYLIEQHTMLTAPSIQVLDSTHKLQQKLRERNSTTMQKQDILVVGNPTMPTDPNGKELVSLATSEEEARAIAALFNTEAITNEKATEDLIAQRMETASIIHLGTHGIPDENRGFGSWVALAPSDKHEGWLTAEEILNMNLNAELVVLSACETGRGRLTGDGMVGLSRSLISAGTPSVVLSLWKVASEPEETPRSFLPFWKATSETGLTEETPTKDLMIQFYQELQQNSDKAQALRQAMLTTKEQYPDPKYWAAFTLIGEAE